MMLGGCHESRQLFRYCQHKQRRCVVPTRRHPVGRAQQAVQELSVRPPEPQELGANLKVLLAFALPALVLPLADPFMSLIDTLCIGKCCSMLELAAMGPATLVFGSVTTLFSAFSATSISNTSRSLAIGDREAASLVLGTALKVALIFGGIVCLILCTFSTQIVQSLGVVPEVVPAAASYLIIRGFASPANTFSVVCSATLLAQKDSRMPFIVISASAFLSFFLDIILVAFLGCGLPGAAATTVFTQYLNMAVFIYAFGKGGRLAPNFKSITPTSSPNPFQALRQAFANNRKRKPATERLTPLIQSVFTPTSPSPNTNFSSQDSIDSQTSETDDASTDAAASNGDVQVATSSESEPDTETCDDSSPATQTNGATNGVPGNGASNIITTTRGNAKKESALSSTSDGIVLMCVYTAKLACYFLVQGSAMKFGVAPLAAHNAVFSVWNLCGYFPVPLQTTALAYVPTYKRPRAQNNVAARLFFMSLALALPLAFICGIIPLLYPGILTPDVTVSSLMPGIALPAALSILFCTIDVGCEGILVAQRRFNILAISMTTAMVLVVYYFLGNADRITGLPDVWWGLALFFAIRASVSSIAVLSKLVTGWMAAWREEREQEETVVAAPA